MEYKVIDDPQVVIFYKQCTTRKLKRIVGIKFPIFGKYRGKMLVPQGLWGKIAPLYLQNGGHLLPKGIKIDADVVARS